MKQTSNQLIFYAPLGNSIPHNKIGGAEVGCLKTLNIYKKAKLNISVIEKPATSKGKLSYAINMFFVFFQLIKLLILKPRAPVHIVGFYRNVVFIEWFMMKFAKMLKHQVIYELRNGSMIISYKTGSKLYRYLLKSLLIQSDIVLCQGLEYIDFIENQWNLKRTYYPNYIMNKYVKKDLSSKIIPPIKLIYFGRITRSKNILLMISILKQIRDHGIDANLSLIGASDKYYLKKIKEKISQLNLETHVFLSNRKSFDAITKELESAHFFVFPSEETQEGHSNALTEAMAFGVVPIVSNVGFNASVCGLEELVIPSINAELYSNKIITILENNKWGDLSKFVHNRVLTNYTENIVGKQLMDSIYSLNNHKKKQAHISLFNTNV